MRKYLHICCVLALFLAGCKTTPTQSEAPSEPLPLAAETFDRVWAIMNDYHFDTNFNGVDWSAMREKYRPLAVNAKSSAVFHDTIQEMLDLLDVSHLAIVPGDLADVIETTSEEDDEDGPGNPGFTVRVWADKGIVTAVVPGSPAAEAGVKPGWLITRVKGVDLARRLKELKEEVQAAQFLFLGWKMINGLINGEPGSEVPIHFLNEKNKGVQLTLKRDQLKGTLVQMGSLPDLYADFSSSETNSPAGRKVGIIRFNMWMLPNAIALDKAVDAFRGYDAIVLDLRGNIGGIAGMVMGAAGHFISEPLSLGTMKMRDNQMNFPVNPRRVNPKGERVEPFSGELVMLTDEISVSASELFAGALQELGRAYIIGRATTGQALPAIHDKLPNGDVLYHPFGDFITAKGGRIEGRGVTPDLKMDLNRKALLAGNDQELEAALRWIDQRPKK